VTADGVASLVAAEAIDVVVAIHAYRSGRLLAALPPTLRSVVVLSGEPPAPWGPGPASEQRHSPLPPPAPSPPQALT
jgi:hypothetical protein